MKKEHPKSIRITCQARIRLSPIEDACLRFFALTMGHVKHMMYVDTNKHTYVDKNEMKRKTLKKYGVTARHYNSLKNSLDGLAKNVVANRKLELDDKKERLNKVKEKINRDKKLIVKLEKKSVSLLTEDEKHKLAMAKRGIVGRKVKRTRLTQKIEKIEREVAHEKGEIKLNHKARRKIARDIKYNRVVVTESVIKAPIIEARAESIPAVAESTSAVAEPIPVVAVPKAVTQPKSVKTYLPKMCFWDKKILKALSTLSKDTPDYAEKRRALRKDLRLSGASEIFLLGTKSEKHGNQSCTPFIEADGSITLRVRMPEKAKKRFPHLVNKKGHMLIKGLRVNYRGQELIEAIQGNHTKIKENKRPITIRLKLDKKSWTVFFSFAPRPVEIVTNSNMGGIGIDINGNHLAVTETDRFGSPINSFNVPYVTYGKTTEQRKANIGDAVKVAVEYAVEVGKPLVVEDLDFTAKKKTLKDHSRRRARALSSFAYSQILTNIDSKAASLGVEVITVNPAYTSLIGNVKYAYRYGLTGHQGAALVICRKGFWYSEHLPKPLMEQKFPDGKGGCRTLRVMECKDKIKHIREKNGESLRSSKSGWEVVGRIYQVGREALFQAARESRPVVVPRTTSRLGVNTYLKQ